MNSTRVLLIVSVACNVLLLALWLSGRGRDASSPAVDAGAGLIPSGETRTNVQVFRQYFSWADVESEDYPAYIANLRRIGCPEKTVRDIIVADVDHLYREQLGGALLPTARQWWQSRPDERILDRATQQRRALARERYDLLTKLLGEGWDADRLQQTPTVAIEVPLDGPLLGLIPAETRRQVQWLSGQTQRRFEALLHEAEPDPEHLDQAAIVRLWQELREGLTSLLSPAQLEEFSIRYSPVAHSLRDGLAEQEFNLTPTELRALYRVLEPVQLQLLALGEETPANATQRRGLLQQQELAYRNALGPARYRQYLDSLDPVMRSAVAAATDAGVPEVAPILETIERLGQEEEAIINVLPGSELERAIARKRLEIEQLEAAAAALGQPVTPSEPPAPPQNRYSVGRGETIADVSRKTGVPVALLIEANPGLQVNNLPAGTSLIIPPWSAPPGFR